MAELDFWEDSLTRAEFEEVAWLDGREGRPRQACGQDRPSSDCGLHEVVFARFFWAVWITSFTYLGTNPHCHSNDFIDSTCELYLCRGVDTH